MKRIKKSFFKIVFLLILIIPISCDNNKIVENPEVKTEGNALKIGNADSKITIKVFSSLT